MLYHVYRNSLLRERTVDYMKYQEYILFILNLNKKKYAMTRTALEKFKKTYRNCCLFVSSFLLSTSAFAAHNDLQISDILMNIYNYITGTIAATIALVVTVFVGYQVLGTGRIEKKWLWSCVIGFGLLFGSKAVTNMLGVTS